MKIKKWLGIYAVGLFIGALIVAAFNMIVDPFGVFGDKVLDWDSYNMNNNPRVAKIAYLDEHHEKYDSYIIGGSKSSSISPKLLNEYFGDSNFYSMLMYGGDFNDYEKTMQYLLDNYEVKNIVLHMSLQELGHFNEDVTDMKSRLHGKVNGESSLTFYPRYLWLNPSYSYDKLAGLAEKQVDENVYSTFIPETGVYNKTIRDQEDLTNLEQYVENNPNFELPMGQIEAIALDKNVAALDRMKKLAEQNGATFTLITGATYKSELALYQMDDLKKYWKAIANVTDFWDFTGYSAISNDPRYFYDSMHYRNLVGDMMLGYIFKDDDVYVPKNFGHYTTKENVDQRVEQAFTPPSLYATGAEQKVPILLYHHISENPALIDSMTISPKKFEQDMKAIKEAGYTTISLKQLTDYVYNGQTLPEKPILITFDDDYYSNYEYAFPVLKKYDMKATIFTIGWSTGRDTHRIEGAKFYPHFGWQQANEMIQSGLVEIQNHSFDMHNTDPTGRIGTLKLENETSGQYAQAFMADTLKNEQFIESNTNEDVFVYSYPLGKYSLQSELMLQQLDYKITLSTIDGVSIIKQGEPLSLFSLKRINAGSEIPSEQLVQLIQQ